jgi:sugar lactone lactonase YvrE
MFAICSRFNPRRSLLNAVGFFGMLGLMAGPAVVPAHAAAPRYPDILPVSRVHAGMQGYGLTTFKGTTISRFEVTVNGVLKNANAGHDLIVIHMKGGPITQRGANIIEGMSGSPIYIGDKIVGAVAYGLQFPKEPIALVTPIEDMLDAWDPNIPQQPSYFEPADKQPSQAARQGQKTGANWQPMRGERVVALPHALDLGGHAIHRLVLRMDAGAPPAASDVAVFRQATSLVTISAGTDADRAWLQKDLRKHGFAVTVMRGAAGGRAPDFKAPPLRPGSVFGTLLACGDIEFGGFGTVTYRRGDRILGFGHPLMLLGALEGAVTAAKVVDIFPSQLSSQIMPVSGPIIGTLRQDRDFSVSGELGRMPRLVPFEVSVHDQTTGRMRTIHVKVFQHPILTSELLDALARVAVEQVHSEPGDVMAQVTTTVNADEVGSVTRSNLVFDASDIADSAAQDLNDITNILSGNPFYPLPIKNAKMSVEISPGHNTATVERIFLKQGHYEPGDTLDIGVVLKPYRRDLITRWVSLKIPSDLPTGKYQLQVRGGMPSVLRFGGFTLNVGAQDTQTPPVNVHQMVSRLLQREQNTDILARLVLNTAAPALEGEKLSELPPNLSALMRSERNSGVRLERDEIRNTQPTEYVVSGTQQLVVNVVRKNSQEPGSSSSFGSPTLQNMSGNAPSILSNSGGATGLSVSDDSLAVSDDGSDNSEDVGSALSKINRLAVPTPEVLPPLPAETLRWKTALDEADLSAAAPTDTPPADTKQKPPKRKRGKADTGKADTTPAPVHTITTVSVSKPEDSSNDKPVGRPLQVWRQTARSDFAPGKFHGTSVSANGELRLTPSLRRLASTSETYIWSLVADGQGNLYAGTGTTGKILKVDSEGKVTTFATLPVVAVQSLLRGKDGTLWVGSGVKGNLYRVATDGTYTLVCALPEKYIVALAQDSRGNLYIGPGGGGTVYKLAAGTTGKADAVPYLKTPADHIMALTVDAQDNLFVGTGNNGILYKVTPDGKSSVLYDAKENAITALTTDADGNLYAGTGPKGLLYRITPDGSATVVYDRATSFFTALQLAPDGTLYASSVNTIYHILPNAESGSSVASVQPLDNPKEVDFLALALTPEGSIYAGTGNIGEVYTSSAVTPTAGPRKGTFESVVHDARLNSRWGSIRWDAQTPSGSSLQVETRTGNVAEPDSTWSAWSAARPASGSEGLITSPSARFIQYRLTLQSDSATSQPSVREVSLDYLPRNQPPKVSFQAPSGGERWAKTQTVRWNGDDPDHDTLTYQLYYSSDSGTNWKPLPGENKTAPAPASTSTDSADASDDSADSSADSASQADASTSSDDTSADVEESGTEEAGTTTIIERVRQLASDTSLPPTTRQILQEGVRRQDESASSSSGTTRQTSRTWDTTSLPDGVYLLKVVASDQASNPLNPLSAQAISEPFLVCNALPQIRVTTRQAVGVDKTFHLEGVVTQSLIAVTAVQYRVDRGDWIAAVAQDGLFDTSQEGFTLSTASLKSGVHTIEIKAFNAAGGASSTKLDVTVP